MSQEGMRKTGINVVGNVSWGTHLCQFYQTKKDLLDILLPYSKAGLENNEFCIWITSKPLNQKEAKEAIGKAIPRLYRYLARGQIEIIPYSEWYLKDGSFNAGRVLTDWVDKPSISLSQIIQGSGERILVVEDQKGVREFLRKALSENGYLAIEAKNAKEALDVFEKEKGNFDLIFCDVVLPDESGIKLADQLLSQRPGLPILLNSGYVDEKSQWPLIRKRGFPFLKKPYGLVDLLQTIKETLQPQ